MNVTDGFRAANVSANQDFTLLGGMYAIDVIATFGGGTVKLKKVQADGTTYISVGASTDFTAAGFVTGLNLPAGQYRFEVTTATAVYAAIQRVPS